MSLRGVVWCMAAWLACPAVASAGAASFTGTRETRPVDQVFGPGIALTAVEQPVIIEAPSGQQLTGAIMVLMDPERGIMWWTYQAGEPEDGRLFRWMKRGAAYADGTRIARFALLGRTVWWRESTDVVDSLDAGLAGALASLEQVAPEFFSAGAWYLFHHESQLQPPVITNADWPFFTLPYHSEALPDADIIGIQRTPSDWVLKLKGHNPDAPGARLQLRHDGVATSFKLEGARPLEAPNR